MIKIKEWFYKFFISHFYLKEKKEIYDRGYAHGIEDQRLKDEIDALERMKSWTIDPQQVIGYLQNGTIMLGGEQVTERQLKNLKAEIRTLNEFEIYGIFINTVRKLALDKAVITATDLYSPKGNEMVLAGKMMVYNLDVLRTIISRIDKAKIK